MGEFIDETGKRYGRLKVLKRASNKGTKTRWECLCDCGILSTPMARNLRNGTSTTCGCGTLEAVAAAIVSHSASNTSEYNTWRAMRQRCNNPKAQGYKHYGGRGISVCERWQNSFENFYADMGDRPEGLTLDRRDNDGDYAPGNCRWASWTTQNNNQQRHYR